MNSLLQSESECEQFCCSSRFKCVRRHSCFLSSLCCSFCRLSSASKLFQRYKYFLNDCRSVYRKQMITIAPHASFISPSVLRVLLMCLTAKPLTLLYSRSSQFLSALFLRRLVPASFLFSVVVSRQNFLPTPYAKRIVLEQIRFRNFARRSP